MCAHFFFCFFIFFACVLKTKINKIQNLIVLDSNDYVNSDSCGGIVINLKYNVKNFSKTSNFDKDFFILNDENYDYTEMLTNNQLQTLYFPKCSVIHLV